MHFGLNQEVIICNIQQYFFRDDFDIVLHIINHFGRFSDKNFGDICNFLLLFFQLVHNGVESLLVDPAVNKMKIRYAEKQEHYGYCGR